MSTVPSFPGLALSTIFLAYVGMISACLAAILLRYLPFRRALLGIAIVAIWLCYAGAVGYSGIVGDPTRLPPGIVLLVAPIIAFAVLVIGRSPVGRYLASHIPLPLILLTQMFRVGVELTLSALHDAGLTSPLLTLHGGNVEILVGLSAPLVALISTRGDAGRRLARVWNVVGLLSLLNVAARAVLTAPGPLNLIHSDMPSVAMGIFPFGFIPGFLAPLAVMLHVLALRVPRIANNSADVSADVHYDKLAMSRN